MPTSTRQRTCHSLPIGRLLLVVAALLAGGSLRAPEIHAQVTLPAVSDTLWEFRLTDRSVVIGRVAASDTEHVTVETPAGTRVQIRHGLVAGVRTAPGHVQDGQYWFPDPNHTRLFIISPTGRMLERGDGYVSAFWIFLPFVAYGVTDNFTIAGGTPILPGAIGRVVYLAPKLRVYQRPNRDIAVGTLAFFVTEELDSGTGGIAYGVGTFGSPDRAITAGAGWMYAFSRGETFTSDRPVLLLGGETRVARTVKLVTENFVVPGENGTFLSGGVRLFGERIAVDLGIGGIASGGDFHWFPAGNFVYNFGRR